MTYVLPVYDILNMSWDTASQSFDYIIITSFLWRHWFKLYARLYKVWTNEVIEI